MISSISVNKSYAFENPLTHPATTLDHFTALVVSADLESRRAVTKILDALSIQTTSCSTLAQAQEALSRQPLNLIFCDERLPDGAYTDLLEVNHTRTIAPPLVVLTRTGEWELYMDATRHGAFDVIRSPWCPTNIELSVIRALKEEKQILPACRSSSAAG
jgi:DNA-binding NtrC family response regulator